MRFFIYLLLLSPTFCIYSQWFDSSDDYFNDAQSKSITGDFRASIYSCQKGLELSPNDMDIKQLLGRNYMHIHELDSARYFLKQVTDFDKKNVQSRKYLVNLEHQTKRYSSSICYINELLEITPYWKELWIKKIVVYKEMGNEVEATRSLKRLHQIFPNDKDIQNQYEYILHTDGINDSKNGNFDKAQSVYLDLLHENPQNKEVFISLINNEIKAGRMISALEYSDRALVYFPSDVEIVQKKIAILDKDSQYDVALEFLRSNREILPVSYYSNNESYLISQGVSFYQNTDAHELHKKAYAKNKNYESFTYLLNRALVQETYIEALRLLNERLKYNSNSKTLLVKRAYVYKRQDDVVKFRISVKDLYTKYPNDYDIKNEYSQIMLEEVKEYRAELDYEKALVSSYELLLNEEYEQLGEENIYNIYFLQKNYPDALVQIDYLIEKYPYSTEYISKKSFLLKEMNNFESSLVYTELLIEKSNRKKKYIKRYVYFSEGYAKYLIEGNRHYKVFNIVDRALSIYPKGSVLLYNYAINAAAHIKDYEKVLNYSKQASEIFPDNLDYKLKIAEANSKLQHYDKAVEVLEKLYTEDPTNYKVKRLLINERYNFGVSQDKKGNYNESQIIFLANYSLDSLHKPTIQRLTNTFIRKKDLVNALYYVDKGLELDPESSFFLYKKGLIYEEEEDYEKAYVYQKKSLGEIENRKEIQEHLFFLENKSLKNKITIFYLKTSSDSLSFNSSLASIFYLKLGEKNNYGLDFNYAARRNGIGIQGKGYWSHIINSRLYTELNVAVASKYFPTVKVTASVFKYFNNDWEGELSLGYSVVQNNTSLFNIQTGVTKTINQFVLNGRLNILLNSSDLFSNLFFQTKYMIDDTPDYVVVMASLGSAPYDDKLDFQLDTFTTYLNSMVGAGYRKVYKSKYTFGIQTNWYNFKVAETVHVNQFHLFFLIQTSF